MQFINTIHSDNLNPSDAHKDLRGSLHHSIFKVCCEIDTSNFEEVFAESEPSYQISVFVYEELSVLWSLSVFLSHSFLTAKVRSVNIDDDVGQIRNLRSHINLLVRLE